MRISYSYEDVHQANVYLHGTGGFLLRGDTASGKRKKQKEQGGRVIHLQSHHLDAACPVGLPWARGISSGNGSPSAQTAPSTKYSFFQMGTLRFNVSISHRLASQAK